METTLDDILWRLLGDPSQPVDPEWLQSVLAKHPTFAIAAAMLLARNPDDVDADTRRQLQSMVALGCADRTAMADMANLAGSDWAHLYPAAEAPRPKTTEDTIDAFLNVYGSSSPEDDALLERLIFNPRPGDYLHTPDEQYVPGSPIEMPAELQPGLNLEKTSPAQKAPAKSEPAEKPAEDAQASPTVEPAAPTTPAEPPVERQTHFDPKNPENAAQEPPLMESLAKIFIKQRRYERALEIISNLSLKYPEKSAYFADQIRFLRKLIANKQYQQAKQAPKT